MLIRTILAVVFLANLFVYVWLSVNAPDELLPDMISGLLDDPVNGLEDAERRLELLDHIPELLKNRNTKIYWLTGLALINVGAIILSLAYITLMNDEDPPKPCSDSEEELQN